MPTTWEIRNGQVQSGPPSRSMMQTLAAGAGGDILSFGGGSIGGNQPGGSQGPLMVFTVQVLDPDNYTTQGGGNSIVSRNTRPGASISLYMPNEMAVTYSTQYEEMEMGSVLGALDEGALNAAGAAYQRIADNAKRMLGSATGVGENVAALQNANQGRAFNPQMELLFKNVNFRTFTFNYKFHPQNASEASEVTRIQNTFKKNMLPSLPEGNQGFFKYPNLFAVEYRSGVGGEGYYHKFGKMVLTDMSINYAGTGVASQFNDGAPVESDMSLSFKEVEFLTSESIDAGM